MPSKHPLKPSSIFKLRYPARKTSEVIPANNYVYQTVLDNLFTKSKAENCSSNPRHRSKSYIKRENSKHPTGDVFVGRMIYKKPSTASIDLIQQTELENEEVEGEIGRFDRVIETDPKSEKEGNISFDREIKSDSENETETKGKRIFYRGKKKKINNSVKNPSISSIAFNQGSDSEKEKRKLSNREMKTKSKISVQLLSFASLDLIQEANPEREREREREREGGIERERGKNRGIKVEKKKTKMSVTIPKRKRTKRGVSLKIARKPVRKESRIVSRKVEELPTNKTKCKIDKKEIFIFIFFIFLIITFYIKF